MYVCTYCTLYMYTNVPFAMTHTHVHVIVHVTAVVWDPCLSLFPAKLWRCQVILHAHNPPGGGGGGCWSATYTQWVHVALRPDKWRLKLTRNACLFCLNFDWSQSKFRPINSMPAIIVELRRNIPLFRLLASYMYFTKEVLRKWDCSFPCRLPH